MPYASVDEIMLVINPYNREYLHVYRSTQLIRISCKSYDCDDDENPKFNISEN